MGVYASALLPCKKLSNEGDVRLPSKAFWVYVKVLDKETFTLILNDFECPKFLLYDYCI